MFNKYSFQFIQKNLLFMLLIIWIILFDSDVF